MSDHEERDVYMTRHSARADRDDYRWRPLPGHKRDDTQLSQGGELASKELSARFESIRVARIVSSPFLRCLQTVAPIAREKGLKIKVEPGICEVLTSYPPGFLETAAVASETDLPVDVEYKPVIPRGQFGQEWGNGDAANRSQRVAVALRERLAGPILFCGHGASCLGISEAFNGSGYVGYSSFSHFRHEKNGNRWQVSRFGDVSHLSEKLKKQSLSNTW